MANYDGFAATNPFKLTEGSVPNATNQRLAPKGYATPALGAAGFGTQFGVGQKAQQEGPFQRGGGLYAAGMDPNNPDTPYNLYLEIPGHNQGDDAGRLQEYFAKYANLPPAQQYLNAFDDFYGNELNRMTEDHSLLGDIGGFLQDYLAPVALGAIPGVGPALAAGYGAINGGLLNDGGILGALTGGLGGFAGGELGSSLATNGIGGTFNNAVTGLENFVSHPLDTAGGWLGSIGTDISAGLTGLENFLGLGGTPGVAGAAPSPTLAGSGGTPAGTGAASLYSPSSITGTGATPTSLAGFGGGDAGTPGGFTGSGTESLSQQFASPTAASPTAGKPSPSFADNAVNALWRAAPGGALIAANALMGSSPPPQQAALDKTATKVGNVGNQLLSQYQSGQLPTSTVAEIQQQITQQKAQIEDYFAKAGAPESTSKIQMLAEVDRKGAQLMDAARQSLLASGLQATGQSGNLQASSLNTQATSDAAQSTALTNLLAQIARASATPSTA